MTCAVALTVAVAVAVALLLAAPSAAAAAAAAGEKKTKTPPHIVYFLVDDLGHANIGLTNDEPITPNIDKLGREGAILNRFYTFRYCSPTRSAFLSGRLPYHVNQENHPPNCPGGGVDLNMTMLPEVLNRANYASYQVGKWHAGMSTWASLPHKRGFNASFGYLSGSEDHFNQKRMGFYDFWRTDGPAVNETGTYGTLQYNDEALRIIKNHNPKQPLFLYQAFQNVHVPLETLDKYIDQYNATIFGPRRKCLGMVSAVDDAIGNITQALKDKGMYDNTLIIFSSDNGGPPDHGNNYPLRAGKTTDFEGGVRVIAYISGGYLPKAMVGKWVDGFMHVTDLYATLAHLAGQDPTDHKAAAANLPPIDSLNMWDMLTGVNKTSPRTSLFLSSLQEGSSAYIKGNYKLIRGTEEYSFFPGIHMPNSTNYWKNTSFTCNPGCLFDIIKDPVEHFDISAEEPEVMQQMLNEAFDLDGSQFQTPGSTTPDHAAKEAATTKYGGFWGPWLPEAPRPIPPAPGPEPVPSGGFFIRTATDPSWCLVVDKSSASDGSDGHVVLGTCDTYTAKWATDDKQNVYNLGLNNAPLKPYLLADDTSCGYGTPLVVRKVLVTGNGTMVDTQTKSLRLKECGLCVGPKTVWGSLGGVTTLALDCRVPSTQNMFIITS